ncbi:MAG: hypothetical protein AB7P04_05050 [Bacteriovoracia bacterium]
MKTLCVILVLAISNLASAADLLDIQFKGTTTIGTEKVDCTVKTIPYEDHAYLEYENDKIFVPVRFDIKAGSTQKRALGTFKKSVPGSGGFGSYTPAEKSKGEIVITLEKDDRYLAKITAENCVERTFLNKGLGIFKCQTTKQTCTQPK